MSYGILKLSFIVTINLLSQKSGNLTRIYYEGESNCIKTSYLNTIPILHSNTRTKSL